MTRHGSQDINSGQKPEFRTLETAYWGWVDNTCSFPRGSNKRKHWLKDNAAFEMNGTIYTRSAHPMWSNSGKSITGWLRSFTGSDGTVISNDQIRNRRNDPDRNWGLGRD